MPRPKSLPDEEVLAAAGSLLRERGMLTLAALADRCGLSPSTLVQRFRTKEELIRNTLRHAWDVLDRQTEDAIAAARGGPDGAVDILVALSGGYGDIETYADGLRILREDLRDPQARARGVAWGRVLAEAIDDRFARTPGAPAGIGRIMISQWQGALLWWSFDPRVRVDAYVRDHLTAFVSAVTAGRGRSGR
ncbi:MAG: TetR/AcrR family transcriptional regulator [Pseudonocardia sp.]|nr:TetR/AcrR family transcriptional regulator [Pseudonocardia sp.]